jgi:hypothetical protein
MNNLEKDIRYAVFTPVFGVRSDRKKIFFRKNKNHKRSQRRLLMIIHEKKNTFFGTDLS